MALLCPPSYYAPLVAGSWYPAGPSRLVHEKFLASCKKTKRYMQGL